MIYSNDEVLHIVNTTQVTLMASKHLIMCGCTA